MQWLRTNFIGQATSWDMRSSIIANAISTMPVTDSTHLKAKSHERIVKIKRIFSGRKL